MSYYEYTVAPRRHGASVKQLLYPGPYVQHNGGVALRLR